MLPTIKDLGTLIPVEAPEQANERPKRRFIDTQTDEIYEAVTVPSGESFLYKLERYGAENVNTPEALAQLVFNNHSSGRTLFKDRADRAFSAAEGAADTRTVTLTSKPLNNKIIGIYLTKAKWFAGGMWKLAEFPYSHFRSLPVKSAIPTSGNVKYNNTIGRSYPYLVKATGVVGTGAVLIHKVSDVKLGLYFPGGGVLGTNRMTVREEYV